MIDAWIRTTRRARTTTALLVAVLGLAACEQTFRTGKVGNTRNAPGPDGTCPSGQSVCGRDSFAQCVDLQSNRQHCGTCAEACPPGIACRAGACEQIACSGSLSIAARPFGPQAPEIWPRTEPVDMNGDGKLDVVEWSDSGAVRVLLGQGDGSFVPSFSYPAWDHVEGYVMDDFVVIGDFDEDGVPDLAVANGGQVDGVDVWLGNGDGSLRNRPAHQGQPRTGLSLGDVNGDGHLDIVTSNGVLLAGHGDGTFSNLGGVPSGEAGIDARILDWDGDGVTDLIAIGDTFHVLLGTGNGHFAPQLDCGIWVDYRETLIGDFNGDGKQDLAVHFYPNHAISVMLGDGRCGLSPRTDYPTAAQPGDLAVGDVTGDGILDLVETDYDDDLAHLVALVGQGDGTFIEESLATLPRNVWDLHIAEVTGDGRADILVGTDQGLLAEVNTCQ